MKKINLDVIIDLFKKHDEFNLLSKYYNSPKYVVILIKQLEQMNQNISSVYTLLDINNICDAYSIYRKFLESYFIIMSVYTYPDVSDIFLYHCNLISKKTINSGSKEINKIRKGHIDGYIEYGYLINYVDPNLKKITMYDVAKCGQSLSYFSQYKICNNFVHNNVNYVNVNLNKSKTELKDALENIVNSLIDKFNLIIKKS